MAWLGICTSLIMLVSGKKNVVNASADWRLSFLTESDPRVIKKWALSKFFFFF